MRSIAQFRAEISVLDVKPRRLMLRVATSCSGQVQQPERPLPTDIAFTVRVKSFSDRDATS
jgi:hypothetical protein